MREADTGGVVDAIDTVRIIGGSKSRWHVYDTWGNEWGDVPEAVSVRVRRTKQRLETGRRRAANRALGIMGHLVGDVAQPMHTASSDREDRIHSLLN